MRYMYILFWPFSKDASSTLHWPQVFVLNPIEERYSVVDMFAGKAAISRAFRAKGLHAATLDLAIDPRDELWLKCVYLFDVMCHVNPCQFGLAVEGSTTLRIF